MTSRPGHPLVLVSSTSALTGAEVDHDVLMQDQRLVLHQQCNARMHFATFEGLYRYHAVARSTVRGHPTHVWTFAFVL